MHKKHYKLIFVAVLFVLAGAFVYFSKQPGESTEVSREENVPQEQPPALYAAINGLLVDKAMADRRPIAVMVENHPDSRPQSGLAEADVVYETLAEGGITRFMAVYQTRPASNIGPVRSARSYFAELADELSALYAHVGGSNEVIDLLKKGHYKNLSDANEYYNETFFQRIRSRVAPHNVYTSIEKLEELMSQRKVGTAAAVALWKFKEPDILPLNTAGPATDINIDFSLPQFAVKYGYDSANNYYSRFMAGKSHMDADSKRQITPKNIVAQFVTVTPVPRDPQLKVNINLSSGGKALVFRDGVVMEGVWKKDGAGRTRYYGGTGEEIDLNRGQTWIELVPNDSPNRVTWQ